MRCKAIAVVLLLAAVSRADIIIGTQPNFSINMALFAPVGQSFTADSSNIKSIGLWLSICNCPDDPPVQYQMTLLNGVGMSGTPVASRTATAPIGLFGFLDFDFNGVTLVVGQTYTVVISQISDSPPSQGLGTPIAGTNDDYSGGMAFISGQQRPDLDFSLRVLNAPPPSCQVSLSIPPLPYYQFAPPWNRNIYANYSPSAEFPIDCPTSTHATIQCFGCALTALSMALYQAGITDLPDSLLPNDPGSLNAFMQNHDGDFGPGNIVDFDNTTRDINEARSPSANEALTFDYTFAGSSSTDDLFRAVCTHNLSGPVPVIVKVAGTSSDHFVLVTGALAQSDGTIKFPIIDPGHLNETTLDAYNNQFEIRGSVKDPPGNNSAINLSVGSAGDLLVINPASKRIGFEPATGMVVHEITGATYARDTLGSDEAIDVPAETAHSVHVPQPQNGSYIAVITGSHLGQYTFVIRVFSQDASAQPPLMLSGISGPGLQSRFQIRFDSAPGAVSAADRVATFQSTLDDIDNGLQLGLIDKKETAASLSRMVRHAEDKAAGNEGEEARRTLEEFIKKVGDDAPRHIIKTAAQILIEDANSLLEQIPKERDDDTSKSRPL